MDDEQRRKMRRYGYAWYARSQPQDEDDSTVAEAAAVGEEAEAARVPRVRI